MAIVGVPTSSPTWSMPSWCEARMASSYDASSHASTSVSGSPTSASASTTTSRSAPRPWSWMRVPMAE